MAFMNRRDISFMLYELLEAGQLAQTIAAQARWASRRPWLQPE
jgi:hypothetical protein